MNETAWLAEREPRFYWNIRKTVLNILYLSAVFHICVFGRCVYVDLTSSIHVSSTRGSYAWLVNSLATRDDRDSEIFFFDFLFLREKNARRILICRDLTYFLWLFDDVLFFGYFSTKILRYIDTISFQLFYNNLLQFLNFCIFALQQRDAFLRLFLVNFKQKFYESKR